MNERIQELRIEAGISRLQDDPRLVVVNKDGNIIDPLIGLEKFAELIVRECVGEIHRADVGDLKGKSYYLDKVSEHIENHFGIEE